MPKDHPELVRARELGVPVIRRAEALGEVTADRELVGIAGTHGKTTTTVMTTTALAAAGRDPTALVGGRVGAWEGSLRAGSDRLYVVEADEYDRLVPRSVTDRWPWSRTSRPITSTSTRTSTTSKLPLRSSCAALGTSCSARTIREPADCPRRAAPR